MYIRKKYKFNGFTIIEVLLVLAIFIIIATTTMPSINAWQNSSSLNTVSAEIKQALFLAQVRAVNGKNNSNHGVHFVLNSNENSALTIYQGNNYSTRNSDYDLELDFDKGIILTSINDVNDVNFIKNNGETSGMTIITIVNKSVNDEKSIMINELGIVR